MNKKYFTILFSLSVSLIFLSCENPNEPILTSPDGKIPVISGLSLYITSEKSPEVIDQGVWRNPISGHRNYVTYRGEKKSPYGTKRNTANFIYQTQDKSLVQIYFVKARLPEEVPVVNLSGLTTNMDYAVSVYEVVNEIQPAGAYNVSIDITVLEKLGYGFYQMYLKTGQSILITDFVVFKNETDIPRDLYDLIMRLGKFE